MKKFILMVFSTILLMGIDLPTSMKTTIQSINNQNHVTLSNPIPKDRSGIVIHSYGNGLYAITHSIVSLGGTRAKISKYNMLKHKTIPTIKTPVKVGDRVIFGNLYNNALLIAPTERIYSSITNSIKRVWIHPDIYATYLICNDEDRITLKNLKKFSIENQVGLVVIVAREGLRVLDPISGKYILKVLYKTNIGVKKAQSPFYARIEQIDTGFFHEESKKEFLPYFQGIDNIK
jgi:hypothetical protein